MIEVLVNSEKTILLFIQNVIRNPILTPFFVTVTRLGNVGLIWIALAVILLIPKKQEKSDARLRFRCWVL